jgi:hypothetical protein
LQGFALGAAANEVSQGGEFDFRKGRELQIKLHTFGFAEDVGQKAFDVEPGLSIPAFAKYAAVD